MILSRATLRWPRAMSAGAAVALVVGTAAAGCFTVDAGNAPPRDSFYFPTGLAISPGGQALFVANSDFDLRYNGGTVQALALANEGGLRERALCIQGALSKFSPLPGESEEAAASFRSSCEALLQAGGARPLPCGNLGKNPNPVLYPGPCAPLGVEPFITRSAIIGAFASGAVLVHPPEGQGEGARLFIPVRGDPSVSFFDIEDDRSCAAEPGACDRPVRLDCGADGEGRCGADFRVGENPYESPRALRLPLEPVGLAAGATGNAIVTAHQTQTAASLILNSWTSKPVLTYVLSGLADGPTEVAALPTPGLAAACGDAISYQPGFLMTYRAAPVLDLLRYEADAGSAPPRGYLTRASRLNISVNTNGTDSRGIAVDDSERRTCEVACDAQWQACEPGCSGERLSCLAACTEIPVRFFVANRSPASLLVGQVRTVPVTFEGAPGESDRVCGPQRFTSAYEIMELQDSVALSYGASRVSLGHIIGKDGTPQLRVFAVAFDSRFIFSYDPAARRVDAIIRTGRGPHSIAFDTFAPTGEAGSGSQRRAHSFMYVAHFTDSYIGVVDLDARRPESFGSMVLTLGNPQSPQESQ
ncbi:YncE family protein [Chondromyces crocatus]|uniref:Uncharacterized protein n=1 Tax=Chondromyces crocatus TaxID=52 RepID=A0A0K1EH13_CHOCO|nr:lactonase family protein [Chondromyces crocatus]AKT39888.1 uncharacterized protein CMC5_040390 [Chondromyces crocatus]